MGRFDVCYVEFGFIKEIMEIEKVYENLKQQGFINYGKVIPCQVIEKMIGKKFYHGDWDFIGKFLALKEHIEDQGHFCTSRKCGPGALRILHANEWAHKLDNLQKTVMRKQKRAINTTQKAELDDLSDREQRILCHVQNKLNMGLQAMSSVLYDL